MPDPRLVQALSMGPEPARGMEDWRRQRIADALLAEQRRQTAFAPAQFGAGGQEMDLAQGIVDPNAKFQGGGASGSWAPEAEPPGTLGEWWDQSTFFRPAAETAEAATGAPMDVYRGELDPASDEAIERMFDLAGMAGTGGLATAGMKPMGSLGTFGGRLARTADLDALAKAEKMAAEGAWPGEIHEATGWFKGVDGQWKFEIDDSASKFVPGTSNPPERLALAQQRFVEQTGQPEIRFANPKFSKETSDALAWVDANMEQLKAEAPRDPLSEVLVHPELYAAYPEMANIKTMPERFLSGDYAGTFNGETITYGGGRNIGSQTFDNRSTLLHEGQHAIQDIEGFGRGSNTFGLRPNTPAWDIYQELLKKIRTPMTREEFDAQGVGGEGYTYDDYLKQHKDGLKNRDFARTLDVEAQKTAVRQAYERHTGEVESRNTQFRRNWTPEQRRAKAPWLTQDVPDELQIVRFKKQGQP